MKIQFPREMHADGIDGFVVVVPSTMSGWRAASNVFHIDQRAARVEAGGIERGVVLPARKTVDVVDIDWTEIALSGARDAGENWLAIRVGNGGLKVASSIPDAPYETLLETLVERQVRRLGIPILLPADMTAVRHQRSKKMIAKRFPFLDCYAFVKASGERLERLKRLNYVTSIVRGAGGEGYATFSHEYLVPLFVRNLEVVDEIVAFRQQQVELGRKLRREALNKQLGGIFPKGRRKRIPIRMLAENAINSLPPRTKQRCQDILNQLKALDKQEESCKQACVALDSAA